MDLAYLHIVTNHIPIVGIPFALLILLLGIWRKSNELKAVAFAAFAILGIITLGVFLLGQGGEDFVEELAGVSHDSIEEHEKMGLISLISVGITAVLSIVGLTFYRGSAPSGRNKTVEKEVDEDGEASTAEASPTDENEEKLLTEDAAASAEDKDDESQKSVFPKWLTFAVLFLALLSAGILGYTGKLGGKIRHTEFYGGAADTEEENGKNRRGQTEEKDTAAEPDKENQTEADAEEADTDSGGKGRGRGRSGKK